MNVEDNAYLLDIIAGEDDLDCTTAKGREKGRLYKTIRSRHSRYENRYTKRIYRRKC